MSRHSVSNGSCRPGTAVRMSEVGRPKAVGRRLRAVTRASDPSTTIETKNLESAKLAPCSHQPSREARLDATTVGLPHNRLKSVSLLRIPAMFEFLRKSEKVLLLKDADAFWSHCDRTRARRHSRPGDEADAEERLDLKAAQAIKSLLEAEVGPEEGDAPVQCQNWDWNDDRVRRVAILRHALKQDVIASLQRMLTGEFADFSIILTLHDGWGQGEAWGCMRISARQIALERHVAQAYSLAN